MKILITGGFGFIGSNLMKSYLHDGHEVIVIDDLSTASKNFVSKVCAEECFNLKRLKFVKADLKSENISHHLEESDIVYHLASSVGVKHVDENPKAAIRNSFDINNNLFWQFEDCNSRVLFASTSEVYGDTSSAKETDVLKIGSPDTLRWGYACGKLMSEFLLRTYEFPSTVVRLFNVTGSGQIGTHGMVLPTFIERAKQNEDIIIYGDGLQQRTFCDIRDAVDMLKILTDGDEHVDEIYNIGSPGNNITIKNLAEEVVATVGSDSNLLYRDYKEDFSNDHGEIYTRSPNTDKMDQYYKAKYSVEDIIASMAAEPTYPSRVLEGHLGVM
jgi:UDP-glucose 4-epimerase